MQYVPANKNIRMNMLYWEPEEERAKAKLTKHILANFSFILKIEL